MKRINIVGASGSGTTTLARALGHRLDIPHFDADDYYWVKTDPPFRVKQLVAERKASLLRDLTAHESWVLSGSLMGSWGDDVLPLFDLVIYLRIAPEIRMARLLQREAARYAERILPGGDMHESHLAFMEYASLYDKGDENVRSRLLHEQWLRGVQCKIIRLEEDLTVEDRVRLVLEECAQ